jgi:AcrR family transcriptional regulator
MKSLTAVKPRTYRSPLRQTQSKMTRLRIIEAATRLFTEIGYGATSIDQIAEAAGVGRATVFTAVGGKPAVLRAAYRLALLGDDEAPPLRERPWARPVRQATRPAEGIRRYAQVITRIGGRVAAIYEAFGAAASADPAVRDAWDEIREERREGAQRFVRLLRDLGPLREGLDERRAADVVWILNDPRLYGQLVLEQGWEVDAFRDWLTETMRDQLLGPSADRAGDPTIPGTAMVRAAPESA